MFVHEFNYDKSYEKFPILADLLFKNRIWYKDNPHKNLANSLGIDYVFLGQNGIIKTVDLKVRKITYPDILLEHTHVRDDGQIVPGWINKPLLCDYIVYVYEDTDRGFFIPFKKIQNLWIERGEIMRSQYPSIISHNHGYKTISTAVPSGEILTRLPDVRHFSCDGDNFYFV